MKFIFESLDRYIELAEKYLDGSITSNEITELSSMVDKAAKKSGYTIKAYHGTKDKFHVFIADSPNKYDSGYLGKGFYFTDNMDFANDYASWKKGDDNGVVMSVYLNMSSPLFIDSDDPNLIAVQKSLGLDLTDNAFYNDVDFSKKVAKEITNTAIRLGYDGIVRYSSFYKDTTYVVYTSEQIKSAELVTLDDNGDIIPLDKRFNKSRDDIREKYNVRNMCVSRLGNRRAKFEELEYRDGSWYNNGVETVSDASDEQPDFGDEDKFDFDFSNKDKIFIVTVLGRPQFEVRAFNRNEVARKVRKDYGQDIKILGIKEK